MCEGNIRCWLGIKQRHVLRSIPAASTLVSRQGEKAELGLVPGLPLLSPRLQAALRQSLLLPSGGTADILNGEKPIYLNRKVDYLWLREHSNASGDGVFGFNDFDNHIGSPGELRRAGIQSNIDGIKNPE
nr:hypothetical protein Iba_scaffold30423CG0010 [Ipomoea batatas]GMC88406.1 hypothetical protein Iba_scaffold36499CG0010 [Ipomoea batatas]GME01273.1 hypothetical protein Iba_scaffold57107CG0010 [Ipomoea batatas]GME20706.1 hypothetical protein Iba_scaffold25911CG0110 [Ipomoea batatas]